MVWEEILTLVGIPAIRGFAGWAENALKDEEISPIEWKQLGETIIRVGVIGAATYFGLNGIGIDVNALGAGASAVILDFLLMAIKNKKK